MLLQRKQFEVFPITSSKKAYSYKSFLEVSFLYQCVERVISGQVIKYGDVKYIANEGMPNYRNPFEKGRLILQFIVEFPESKQLTPKVVTQLEKHLPPRTESIIPDDAEEAMLQEYHDSHAHTDHRRTSSHAHMEDDEDDGRAQGVQCATQ